MNTNRKNMAKALGLIALAGAALPYMPAPRAQAAVLLKPKGEYTRPMRLKQLEAKVEIEGQFATTQTVMTFQNEMHNREEVDFIYTLPEGSVGTYFAYWYGDEKVVARVVEKERAAAIYQHITSRMRDPALIELVGKNTYRVRIFPIMPNNDLRVEMHSVETLATTKNGARYTFPLAPESKGTGTLDKLDIKVTIRRDAGLLGAGNDMALPVESGANEWTMHLNQTNFRPTRDLRVGLTFKDQPLRARILAAPAGGSDGFFALALTPNRNTKAGPLRISGVRGFDIYPRRLPALKAGHTFTVVGRYRLPAPAAPLSGGATVAFDGLRAGTVFGLVRRNENAASKLWAARAIETAGRAESSRARVIALSQRYGLPSFRTSWLAIPEAERQRYHAEKAEADYQQYARDLARLNVLGRSGTPEAARVRKQLYAAARTLGYDANQVRWAVKENSYSAVASLADAYVEARQNGSAKEKAAARRRLRIAEPRRDERARLITEAERQRENAAATLRRQRTEEKLAATADAIAEEVFAGRLNEPRIEKLRHDQRKLKALNGITWSDTDSKFFGALSSQAHIVAWNIEKEKTAAIPDAKKLEAWQNELLELKKKSGNELDMTEHLNWARDWVKSGGKPFDTAAARELYLSQYWGHGGDPLILIEAPADAQQVVAILPDGSVKQLAYDTSTKRWEARFDVPMYTREGLFEITVVIVAKDGTRKTMKLHYEVDLTSPRGEALAQRSTAGGKYNLSVQGDRDTARVSALLPSGEKVELKRSATEAGRFLTTVDMPQSGNGDKPPVVTYILTDRAHNRTQVTVDLSQ